MIVCVTFHLLGTVGHIVSLNMELKENVVFTLKHINGYNVQGLKGHFGKNDF
jgi:hypothetical protein